MKVHSVCCGVGLEREAKKATVVEKGENGRPLGVVRLLPFELEVRHRVQERECTWQGFLAQRKWRRDVPRPTALREKKEKRFMEDQSEKGFNTTHGAADG